MKHEIMHEKIVNCLKESPGYISGEDISRVLDISRAGIWKYMQELRHRGYDIIAVPHLGYQLVSIPDRLLPWEIKYNLGTKTIGKEMICFEAIPSTMNEAFTLGMAGAPEGTVIFAEGQTRGRGRLGRTWSSPTGKGIYFSILLRPQLPLLLIQSSRVLLEF